LTVDDEHKRDIWGPVAKDLLCALFLAAATSGRTLREVDRWLGDAASPIPAELLDRAGFSGLASSLRGMQNGAPETRDGIYQTARTAAACLGGAIEGRPCPQRLDPAGSARASGSGVHADGGAQSGRFWAGRFRV
jgi:hypothetical protein